ncbi:uncharacterized protein geko [Periplaneta americana]|uniref:uncharacterized protein geko n=1 Tax=Periplaneta americana TaxID=6978 RepID=UPI0037E70015
METVILRILLLVILFFLLTGDYTALFNQILQQGSKSVPAPRDARTTSKKYEDDDADNSHIDDALEMYSATSRSHLMATIKNSCLPKLICELNASPHKEKLTDSEKSLLSLIRDTSISVTAEVTSKYHFAAHMGQLIAGVDGAGCHNFYPTCPFPGLEVLHMMKKVKIR